MPNIKEIRERIHSVNATQKMTKTMQLVSSSKLVKAQHQLAKTRKYTDHVIHIFNNCIAQQQLEILQPYFHPNHAKKRLLILISTEKGLCGSFNSNIIKHTEAYLATNQLSPDQVDILAIGKKANNHFKKQDYTLITTYQTITANVQLTDVTEATHWMINAFLQQRYSCVELIYNNLETAATYAVQVERLLPFDLSLMRLSPKNSVKKWYILEPSHQALLEEIIPLRLSTQLYQALITSNTAEHSARMTAMSKASENANTILKSLRVTYNKTRQASITNEILEIAAVAEALRKKQ